MGLIPAVIVSPADSALISDAADERRRYLNAFISQLDRAYLGSVMRYNAVLAERNRLLKTRPDETMLQIYDMQLCEHGKRPSTPGGRSSPSGCSPWPRPITASSRATGSRSNCTTNRS